MRWQSRCQPICSYLMFGQGWKVCLQDGLLRALLVRSFNSLLAVNKIPSFLTTWATHSVVHDITANFSQSSKWVMWGKPNKTVVSFITSSWMTFYWLYDGTPLGNVWGDTQSCQCWEVGSLGDILDTGYHTIYCKCMIYFMLTIMIYH